MSLRDALNRNSVITLGAALVVIGLAIGYLVVRMGPPRARPGPTRQWFYDLNTGERFKVPMDATAPIDAPSGRPTERGTPAGVKLYVLSCGECGGGEEYPGYLETYTPQAKELLESVRRGGEGDIPTPSAAGGESPLTAMRRAEETGLLVAKPERPPTWVPAASERGLQLINEAYGRCGDRRARVCHPG